MRSLYTWNVVLWIVVYIGVPTLFYLVFRRLARGEKFEYPACARCFYQLGDIPSSVCPECGASLQHIGTVTHRRRRWWAVTGQVLALGCIILYEQLLIASLVIPFLPSRVETMSTIALAPTDRNAQYTFNIVSRASHWQPRTHPYFETAPIASHVQVWFHQPGATYAPTLDIDRTHNTYTILTGNTTQQVVGTFGRRELIAWLQSLPPNLSADDAAVYSNTIMRLLEDSVDALDTVREFDAQWEQESASGRITMPLKNIGDFRSSRPWSDDYLSLGFLGLSCVIWLWLTYRIVRRPRYVVHGK